MKTYFALTIIIFLSTFQLHSQVVQQRSWTDGVPLFDHVIEYQGVQIDSTIRLTPILETQSPDSFQYILYGEDGIWPIQKFPIGAAYDIDFLDEKNKKFYLVTDGYGRRIFEINYTNPNNPIEAGFSFTGQSRPLINPVDASIFYENGDRKILITDNGGNRVIKVDRLGGDEEWTYGDGSSGRGFNQLSGPTDALALPDTALYLISDQGNSRIIMVEPTSNQILWFYGEAEQLNPVDLEYDATTNSILVTDRNHHRVIIVNIATSVITWQFGTGVAGDSHDMLNNPNDADFLPNGNILICDTGNERLLEVDSSGTVVWSFEHRRLINLREADRLPDNRTIIVADYPPLLTNVPIWLGYSDSVFTSPQINLGKKVNFDSLYWIGVTPVNTQIKLQIRSADNAIDLTDAPWQGPSASESYFINPASAVNSIQHQAHSYYQFRAYLETNDTLHTPVLNSLQLRYHYYNNKQPGTVTSEIINDSTDMIITEWSYLNFKTILTAARDIKISMINPVTQQVLKDFYAEDIDTVSYRESLSIWNELKGLQLIQLKATLSTNNTATTPFLTDWGVEWNRTLSSVSHINFVNASKEQMTHYRVSPEYPPKEKKIDQVFIRLIDQNLAAVQEAMTIRIEALRSNDVIDVLLKRNPEGEFVLENGIPAVVFNLSIPGNSFLEVFDRDTLVVTYADPTTPTDQSSDRALIVQNSIGELSIMNRNEVAIDTLSIGDTLYVSLTSEADQNITFEQDTVWVDIINNETGDREYIPLIERPDSNDQYYSGNFRSADGLQLLQNPNGVVNDNVIQVMPSNRIAARYEDNVTLQDYLFVLRTGVTPPDSVFILPRKPLDFDVAPNPFYIGRNPTMRLRASSAIGNLIVERVEVYNLSGQKVKTISGAQLRFDLALPIPQNTYAYCENFWDLKNDADDYVSSGVYWIKMYGAVSTNGGSAETLTAIKKVIIFR